MIISNPKRPLDKGVEISRFEYICQKIAPYVVLISIIILLILTFTILIKYGGAWFGTEANHYYYGDLT